jgi:addiction module HigA family antidote
LDEAAEPSAKAAAARSVRYPTPGGILLEELLKPMGSSQRRLAKEIGVPQRRIGERVAGKRAVTADTGLRLSKYFGASEGLRVGLQLDHDAAVARGAMADGLAKIRPWRSEQGGAA